MMKRFILKTNINSSTQVSKLKSALENQTQIFTWSVDMDDIDKVLVVNANHGSRKDELISLIEAQGINCEELPD